MHHDHTVVLGQPHGDSASSVAGNVTMSTSFFSCSSVDAFLCFCYCLPVCFLNSLRKWLPKHSWRKTILLLSKLRLGLSGILELAGSDCLFENTLHDTFLDFVNSMSFSKRVNRDRSKEKKRRSTSRIHRNNTAGSTGVPKARHLWTNLALPCVADTHSFEKQYNNRLMQNQAMQITARRALRHRAILGDFASRDSQIAMETRIIGCRITRFCFSVTGLLPEDVVLGWAIDTDTQQWSEIGSLTFTSVIRSGLVRVVV